MLQFYDGVVASTCGCGRALGRLHRRGWRGGVVVVGWEGGSLCGGLGRVGAGVELLRKGGWCGWWGGQRETLVLGTPQRLACRNGRYLSAKRTGFLPGAENQRQENQAGGFLRELVLLTSP